MPTTYLIDASALYLLILKLREKILDYTDLLRILDLTIYEVGNAVVKDFRRGLIRNVKPIVTMFEEVLKDISIVGVKPRLTEVVDLALKENITLYDSYHIYTAKSMKLKLVTEDKDLLKFPEALNVDTMLAELRYET